jgi:hypothetical protein
MDCSKCHELISDFVDGTLLPDDHMVLSTHLDACLSCSEVQKDLDQILSYCQVYREDYSSIPNERAMWLQIRGSIESESRTLSVQSAKGFWTRLLDRRWELSFPQLTSAVAAIVIAVSGVTFVGLRELNRPDSVRPAESSLVAGESHHTVPYNNSLSVEYLTERVMQRKSRWNPQLRDAFERNLNIIDQTVSDAQRELRRNPHDSVSEQMLHSAINEKMSLLKEFSEL